MKVKKQQPTPKKVCEKCGRKLPFSAFKRWKNKHAEGHESICKECKQLMKEGKPIRTVEQVADLIVIRAQAVTFTTVFYQILIQSLLTEAILDHKDKIKAHPFCAHKAKKFLLDADKSRIVYERKMLQHYDDATMDRFDEAVDEFLNDMKDKRTQIYYANANYFAKIEHPERHLITRIEFMRCMANVVKNYRKLFVEKMRKYNLSLNNINKFIVDVAVNNIFSLADECKRKYKYTLPSEADAPHLYTAGRNLYNAIDRAYEKHLEVTYKGYLEDYEKKFDCL